MTTLDYLEKLLAFDTTSAHPNIELIAWVQAQLEAMGAVVQVTPMLMAVRLISLPR